MAKIAGGIAVGIYSLAQRLEKWLEKSGEAQQVMRAKETAPQTNSLNLMEGLKMENICNKEYAQFMEETLEHMAHLPVTGICILLKLEDGAICSNYFNSQMMNKMIYAGVIQQDVTQHILKARSGIGNKADRGCHQ